MISILLSLLLAELRYQCSAPTMRVAIVSVGGCKSEEEIKRAAKVMVKSLLQDDARRFHDDRKETAKLIRELTKNIKCEYKEVK